MKLKVKWAGKMVEAHVYSKDCRKKKCLVIGYYTHRSAAGMSGVGSRTSDELSCLTRDRFGCPDADNKEVK